MRLRPMVRLPAYLLSCDELAHWLRVQPSTIRKWTCYNRIPYVKIGRKVGYRPADIESWIDACNPQMAKWKRLFRKVG